MRLFPIVGRQQLKTRLAWWLVVAVLAAGVIIHLLPFYYMISTSLKPVEETRRTIPTLWPENFTFRAWANVRYPLEYLRNSLIITLGTLVISLPVTALAAYANSKLQTNHQARWFFLFFIGTLMVPTAVTLIPAFLLTRNFPFPLPHAPLIPGTDIQFPYIRTWDTHWAVILPGVFNAFNFLLFKGYFDTIPDSVLQAARVDGGSELNIFRRIVLPMSIPVFTVAAWFQFGSVWDMYLWPRVVYQSRELLPLGVVIGERVQGLADGAAWPDMMVWALVQALPVFVAFVIAREYLLKGIRLRGLR